MSLRMLFEAREILAAELAVRAQAASLRLVEAADFVTGGRADFARLISDPGVIGTPIRRELSEDPDAFRHRVQALGVAAGARFGVIGGIDPSFDPMMPETPVEPPPHDAIALPDGPLHLAQRRALRLVLDRRRAILRAGRRLGKSTLCCAIAADEAMCGRLVGYVTPQYKIGAPCFDALLQILRPLISSRDRTQGLIKLDTAGEIDVWTTEAGMIIGRGRKYHRLIADEIAHVLDSANMPLIWASALAPTLLDFRGSAIAASTPNGVSPANWFFVIANSKDLGWEEFHAPSSANPFLDPIELEDIRQRSNPMVFRQEYEAEFVSLDGAALFNLANLLQDSGEPWPAPNAFDYFYICIDTAMKTGSANDGNGVVYVGLTERYNPDVLPPIMYILDWDLMQVGAGKIEPWFQMIWERCKEMIGGGSFGPGRRVVEVGPAYVEDAAAGTIIIENHEGLVEALPQQWLRRGKDLRALAVERYMNSGRVRITEHAYNKVAIFKELTMNHLWAQLNSFVMGDPEAHKRSDDLLDAVVYCASVASLDWPAEK
jgi:hypothetical protein